MLQTGGTGNPEEREEKGRGEKVTVTMSRW